MLAKGERLYGTSSYCPHPVISGGQRERGKGECVSMNDY